MADPGAVRARDRSKAGDTDQPRGSRGDTASAPEFTGARRQAVTKVCACGCNEKFKTSAPDKKYKNGAHKQRHYRRTNVQNSS